MTRDLRGERKDRRSPDIPAPAAPSSQRAARALASFERLDETEVFDGHVFSVAVATFADAQGDTFRRDILHHPGAVGVVPVHDDGTITLVRQFRAGLGHDLLEIPAGLRDVADEPPEVTAARELAEEVGLAAEEMRPLNRFHNAAGYSDEEIHIFEARGLREVESNLQGPEEQAMTVERYPLADCVAMVAGGEITDAKTIIAVLLLAQDG